MKRSIRHHWDKNRQLILLSITAFILIAGVIQYAFALSYILPLTPIILAIITGVVLLVWDVSPRKKAVISASVIVSGFALEQIGVHTGLLFGNYAYGTVLGFRLAGVPITIGLTWFLVTLSAWHIVGFGQLSVRNKFLLAGALVVMLDLVLEQFAVASGLWTWQGGSIPMYNYACWFLLSELFFFAYYRFTKQAEPSLFIAGQLPLMAIFFWLMLLVK